MTKATTLTNLYLYANYNFGSIDKTKRQIR
jgi:hypothetical protein